MYIIDLPRPGIPVIYPIRSGPLDTFLDNLFPLCFYVESKTENGKTPLLRKIRYTVRHHAHRPEIDPGLLTGGVVRAATRARLTRNILKIWRINLGVEVDLGGAKRHSGGTKKSMRVGEGGVGGRQKRHVPGPSPAILSGR